VRDIKFPNENNPFAFFNLSVNEKLLLGLGLKFISPINF